MAEAYNQAIQALKTARDEALARLAAIDQSLIALGALEHVSRPLPADAKETVADAIVRLLRSQGGAWDAAAIVQALREENFHGLNEADPIPGVRTALSRLAKAKRLVKPRYGYYAYPPATSMKDLVIDEYADFDNAPRGQRLIFDPAEEPF